MGNGYFSICCCHLALPLGENCCCLGFFICTMGISIIPTCKAVVRYWTRKHLVNSRAKYTTYCLRMGFGQFEVSDLRKVNISWSQSPVE